MAAQAALAARVAARLIRTTRGETIETVVRDDGPPRVGIIVPVLNEVDRLTPCLEGLVLQGPIVGQIVIADGGSHDGTQGIVARFARLDPRVTLVQCPPAEPGRNGKATNLLYGASNIDSRLPWLLMVDADVRPGPALAVSLVHHARQERVAAMSVATRQALSSWGEGLLHPAMLTTLVYRFGIPGHATGNPTLTQANGQCFLIRRDVLQSAGGFAAILDSVCEDVTLARLVAASGERVGFYEPGADDLVRVVMYESAKDAWRNWLRSLPMRDRFWSTPGRLGLAEVALVQAAPLPVALLLIRRHGLPATVGRLNMLLFAMRLGILRGTARAYPHRPWTYWMSPVCDVPVAIGLLLSSVRRVHRWRGQPIVRGDPR